MPTPKPIPATMNDHAIVVVNESDMRNAAPIHKYRRLITAVSAIPD